MMHSIRYISRSKARLTVQYGSHVPSPISTGSILQIRDYRTKAAPKPTISHQSTAKSLSTTTLTPSSITFPQTLTTSIPPHPIILPGSPHHSSLPTFLNHARTTNLNPTSPTYVGTYYEYLVLSTLSCFGFTLTRTGRANDAGIDLLGTWTLPSGQTLRVVVQCKSHARALRPEHVRELEGAVQGAPSGWKGAIGLLVGRREATKGVRERVGASEMGVGYIMVDYDDATGGVREGKVKQFLWNYVAQERGLEGLGVTVKYSPSDEGDGEEIGREIALTWNGWVVKRVTELQDVQTTVAPELPSETLEEIPAPKKRGRPRKTVTAEPIDEVKHKKVAPKAAKPRGQKKKK